MPTNKLAAVGTISGKIPPGHSPTTRTTPRSTGNTNRGIMRANAKKKKKKAAEHGRNRKGHFNSQPLITHGRNG
jgi:hypothetical protein